MCSFPDSVGVSTAILFGFEHKGFLITGGDFILDIIYIVRLVVRCYVILLKQNKYAFARATPCDQYDIYCKIYKRVMYFIVFAILHILIEFPL